MLIYNPTDRGLTWADFMHAKYDTVDENGNRYYLLFKSISYNDMIHLVRPSSQIMF